MARTDDRHQSHPRGPYTFAPPLAPASSIPEDSLGATQAYAIAQAELARVKATAYADGIVTEAEARAIAAAEAEVALLDTRIRAWADGEIDAAEAAAIAEAELRLIQARAELDGQIDRAEAAAIAEAELKLVRARAEIDGQIDAAEAVAIADAELKLVQAKALLDGRIDAAEALAIAEAELRATQTRAELDGVITAAEQRAIDDATRKVAELRGYTDDTFIPASGGTAGALYVQDLFEATKYDGATNRPFASVVMAASPPGSNQARDGTLWATTGTGGEGGGTGGISLPILWTDILADSIPEVVKRWPTVAEMGAAQVGRKITAGAGMAGGGDLSADRSLAIDRAAVDAWYRAASWLPTPAEIGASAVGHTHAWADVSKTGSNLKDLATRVITDTTGTLTVARGGTGLVTLTVGNLLLGNGANNPTLLAPGGTGGFLRSNGAAWVREGTLRDADFIDSYNNVVPSVVVSVSAPGATSARDGTLWATEGSTGGTGGGGASLPILWTDIIADSIPAFAKRWADWSEVTGKPTTFAPGAHALDSHTGTLSWVNLSKTGSSLADLATRSAADLTSGVLALARIPTGTTAATVALGNHTHTLAALGAAAAAHAHSGADITSGTVAYARLPVGTAASTVAIGNHNHDAAYVKGNYTANQNLRTTDSTTFAGLTLNGQTTANDRLIISAGLGGDPGWGGGHLELRTPNGSHTPTIGFHQQGNNAGYLRFSDGWFEFHGMDNASRAAISCDQVEVKGRAYNSYGHDLAPIVVSVGDPGSTMARDNTLWAKVV